jgi:hypothetical protein
MARHSPISSRRWSTVAQQPAPQNQQQHGQLAGHLRDADPSRGFLQENGHQ